MTAIEKLIQTALAEEGYLEKTAAAYRADKSILDQKTAWAGSENYTKYWRDMRPEWQGQPWCDCFVGWCFMKAFGEQIGNNMMCGGMRSYYTPTSANCFASKGRLSKTPQPGDQVFFTKNGTASGCYHTGIVVSVDSGFVMTIEGNTSGASGVIANGGGVARKSYSLVLYNEKLLFGHPDYSLWHETANAEKPKEKPKEKKESGRPEDVKMRHLKSNMTGKAVKIWQVIIGSEVNGVFDLLTEKTTVKWKKQHKLDDSPTVGDKAWKIGLESVS